MESAFSFAGTPLACWWWMFFPPAHFRRLGNLAVALFILSVRSGMEAQPPVVIPNPPTPVQAPSCEELIQLSYLEAKRDLVGAVPVARKILGFSPLEGPRARAWGALRARALGILKRSALLDEYIAELEARGHAAPDDRKITLSLAEAVSLTDAEKAVPFFRKAGLIAPLDAGLQLKLASGLAGNGEAEEAMDLYDQLLTQYLGRTLVEAKGELVPLYLQEDALTRLTNQIAEGIDAPPRGPRQSYATIPEIDRLADEVLKTGDEENAIRLLKFGLPTPHSLSIAGSDERKAEELRLLDLLIKHDRRAEALDLIVGSFSPRPYDEGLPPCAPRGSLPRHLISDGGNFAEADRKGAASFPATYLVAKVKALDGLDQLVSATRANAEEHPEELDQQTLYAVVVAWGQVEKGLPFLSDYFTRVTHLESKSGYHIDWRNPTANLPSISSSSGTPPVVSDRLLLAIAEQLREWPAARDLVFPALRAAQVERLRNDGNDRRSAGLDLDIAAIALEMNDLPRAQEILQQTLKRMLADSHRARWSSIGTTLDLFDLLLRARLKKESAEVLQILLQQDRPDTAFSGSREAELLRGAARVALDGGAADLANLAASRLPQTLAKAANDEYLRPDDLTASVQLLLRLHRFKDARSLVQGFQGAKSENKNFTLACEQSQKMVRRFAGQASELTPTIFLNGVDASGANLIRWDLAGMVSTSSRAGEPPAISALEGNATPLSSRFRITVLTGENETHLSRVAEIRTRDMRGSVRATLPPKAHFGRILVTADDGATNIGSAILLNPTKNLIVNSSFDGVPAAPAPDRSARIIRGWNQVGGGEWFSTEDGPLARAIAYRLTGPKQVSIVGQRIAVSPNDEFFQSAWIAQPPRGSRLRIGRRYLNRDGVELGLSYLPEGDAGGLWFLVQERLERASVAAGGGIPSGCAFIEPVIEVMPHSDYPMIGESARWSGLYLGRLVPPPGKKSSPLHETILFSAKETPARIAVSEDSRFIALGYANGAIRLLDRHGRQLAETSVGSGSVISLCFLRDSSALIAFGVRGEVRRLTLASPFQNVTLIPAAGEIREAEITSEGATAIVFRIGRSTTSEGESGRFEIIDLSARKITRVIETGWQGVFDFVVAKDGCRFFAASNHAVSRVVEGSASRPGNLELYPHQYFPHKLWQLPSGDEITLTPEQIEGKMDYLEVLGKPSPSRAEGNRVGQKIHAIAEDIPRDRAIYAGDGKLYVYDRVTRQDLCVFPLRSEVRRLAIIPDGGTILGIGDDGTVRQWKVPEGADK